MKAIIKLTSLVSAIIILICSSCKKESICSDCKQPNKAPVANAGADITAIYPNDSILLDGSASKDPDDAFLSYHWVRLSGPDSSSNIENAVSAKIPLRRIVPGKYQFELTVTDAEGLSSKDTVQVNDKVEGSLSGREFIVNLVWQVDNAWDSPSSIDISYNNSDIFPDEQFTPAEISVLTQNASDWTPVSVFDYSQPPVDNSYAYLQWYTGNIWIGAFQPNYDLIGTPVMLKIKFP